MRQFPVICLLLVLSVSLEGFFPPPCAAGSVASVEEGWRTELEDLCSRSNSAMTFSRTELKALLERCDKLKPSIEALDESSRKVYGRRLKMCRDFYLFMLESKKVTVPD